MKNIISGHKDFLKTASILFVDVPQYDEFKPENFLKETQLEIKLPKIYQ